MPKRLSPVETFYIEQHRGKMSPEIIAKQIGCTARTVYNYLAKSKGETRTEEGRAAAKGDVPSPPVDTPTPPPEQIGPPEVHIPPPGMQLLGRKKNGNSAAVAMTKEMSEVGDEIFKKSGTKKKPSYLFVMDPNKED